MLSLSNARWNDLDPQKQKIAFLHAAILDADREIADGVLIIHKNKIVECGSFDSLKSKIPSDALQIDACGVLITPGLINSHTHCALSYLRSLGHGQKQMIENLFFKTETQLTEALVESLCYSDLLTGLHSGVTTFIDHYYFHRGVARAIDQFGLRGVVAETCLDVEGPFHGWQPWENFKKSIENWNFSERLTPCVGPHASNTVSPKMFRELADFAKTHHLSIHFHLAQTQREWDFAQKNFGKSPVAQARDMGALGSRTLAVHLLHVSDDDLKILHDTGTHAGFCPSSQVMYEKLAPIERFIKAGVKWTLGTDCAASNDLADLHAEMKVATLFALDRQISQPDLARQVFRASTVEAAQVFGLKTGLLQSDYLADLVFHNLGLQALPAEKLYETFVFSLNSQQVASVMVDGHWRLWNAQPIGLDLPALTTAYNGAVAEMHRLIRST